MAIEQKNQQKQTAPQLPMPAAKTEPQALAAVVPSLFLESEYNGIKSRAALIGATNNGQIKVQLTGKAAGQVMLLPVFQNSAGAYVPLFKGDKWIRIDDVDALIKLLQEAKTIAATAKQSS